MYGPGRKNEGLLEELVRGYIEPCSVAIFPYPTAESIDVERYLESLLFIIYATRTFPLFFVPENLRIGLDFELRELR